MRTQPTPTSNKMIATLGWGSAAAPLAATPAPVPANSLERRLLSVLRESVRVTEIRAGVSAFDVLRQFCHWVNEAMYYGSIRVRSMSSFPANAIRVHGEEILSVDLYDPPAAAPPKSKVGMMEHSCICKREGGRHTATCDEVKERVESEKCICASMGHDRGSGAHAAACNAKRMEIIRGMTTLWDGPGSGARPCSGCAHAVGDVEDLCEKHRSELYAASGGMQFTGGKIDFDGYVAWPAPVRLAPETIPGVGAIPRSEPATRVVGVYDNATNAREDNLFNGRPESATDRAARLAARVEPKVGLCRKCGFRSCMHPRAA